jgi:uncharacterized damage-inducible protein DinB
MVEPWLRGTLKEVDAVRRQVLHALELAGEDAERWCSELSEEELKARPLGLPPVSFHLRHIARSLDRLLTYAEGRALEAAQMEALQTELRGGPGSLQEFREGLRAAAERVRGLAPESLEEERFVGRQRLETTLGGLLVHCAEHTQRHAGQAVTTAKVVVGMRSRAESSTTGETLP